MAEKNSTRSNFIRRQKDAPAPASVSPMRRQSKPAYPAQKPLLDFATPQEALTAEQLQPLSKREKPQPSENVFPAPLPSKSVNAGGYTQFRAATATPSAAPMTRHTVQTGLKADWKYTSAESIANTQKPNEEGEVHKEKRNGVSAEVVKMPINKKPFILGAIAICLALIIILGCIFGIVPASGWKPALAYTDKPASKSAEILSPVDPNSSAFKNSYDYEYASITKVGYSAKVLGTVDKEDIVKPVKEIQNEGLTSQGLSKYPTYGSTPSGVLGTGETQVALRNKLIAESAYLASSNTSHNSGSSPHPYNKIDAEGKLWYVSNGTTSPSTDGNEQRYLYAHTSSVGMYGGNVSDDEPRVIKEVTMRKRGYNGYGVTGLYAPAGEVIKVEIDEKDMNSTGGLTFHIGQALYNGQANNIWTAKNQMNRFPVILNTLVINKNTATKNAETGKWEGYIGSFLGGPIYIRNSDAAKFTATITGAVEYRHFILGSTTEADLERTSKSTAPYFDLEVWDRGVLHSGPKSQAQKYSYQDLYNVAVLWDKVSSVTTYNSNQGIVFIYDPFVAAGAAVAFPGRRSVNCPTGWMSSSLNYNAIVSSGSWGNFHEYHHNFQNYGLGSGADGEVTNNGLNLVSYALFTKITSKRGIGSYGAQGVGGGWNNYTCATWALQQVKAKNIQSTNGLACYATLLHNFGADAYTRARGSSGKNNYLNKWANVTHHDFTYYAGLIESYGGGTYTPSDAVKNANYPMFVPVSCVYQTGRSYLYDGEKKYSTTMQPYVIPAGQEFNIDLSPYSAPDGRYASGSVVIPEGFEYTIKSVTKPANGKIEVVDGYNLKYTPDPKNKSLRSGQILVTLEIKKKDGAFEVEDTDLILEFEQSYEMNKMTLERTTYTYTPDKMYTDAVAAYDANFAGSISKVERNHSNPTQNCNTDIWLYPDTEENRNNYPNAPEEYFFHENQVDVIDGKLYFAEDGTYRVYLRGRKNCALYFSLDGKSYKLGATIKNGSGSTFYQNDPDTYLDITFAEGKVTVDVNNDQKSDFEYTIKRDDKGDIINWLYIKEVLIIDPIVRSYIGVGSGQWTQTMFTMAEKYYDSDNNEVESTTADGYAYTKVTYKDYNGSEVAYSRKDKDSKTTQYFKKSGNSWVPSTEKEVSELTESKLIAPKSASYSNAYRTNYQFPDNSSFQSDYFYVRGYNYNYSDNRIQNPTQTLLDTNYTSKNSWNWGTYPSDKIADGNKNTMIHTNFAVTETKPLYFTIDMGAVKPVNRMTIYTQYRGGNGDWLCPRAFTLEGSIDGVEYFNIGNFTNDVRNTSMTFNFEETSFRYYKLTVTRSDRLLILAEIEMWHVFELTGNGANNVAPKNDSLIFSGKWHSESMQSTYGYMYVGEKGSKIKFEMIGTRLAILTSTLYENKFDVYIDGKKCPSIEVKDVDDEYGITYISQKYAYGKHKVEIRCKDKIYFDSLAIYNEDKS